MRCCTEYILISYHWSLPISIWYKGSLCQSRGVLWITEQTLVEAEGFEYVATPSGVQ